MSFGIVIPPVVSSIVNNVMRAGSRHTHLSGLACQVTGLVGDRGWVLYSQRRNAVQQGRARETIPLRVLNVVMCC